MEYEQLYRCYKLVMQQRNEVWDKIVILDNELDNVHDDLEQALKTIEELTEDAK